MDAKPPASMSCGRQTLPPGPEGKIAVSLWLARDPRILLAGAAPTREVA